MIRKQGRWSVGEGEKSGVIMCRWVRTGAALVAIRYCSTCFVRVGERLVTSSAVHLSGHPVGDDKGQAHDHEDESQRSEARGLTGGEQRVS